MSRRRRWVVKAGSKMVCDGGPLLLRTWMHQVLQLRKQHNIEVIWVTSGAIASAARRTDFNQAKRTLPQKQALSAIGQPIIMDQYNLALQAEGLLGSQVLLTAGDIRDKARSKNLKSSLNQLLQWNVIPILNENDAVSTDEIQFGDNDSLASQVAIMMNAERLVLLTDVDGLFDADPNRNKKAQLIHYCKTIGRKELALADGKIAGSIGTGGMASKLLAAQKATKEKIITHLVKGDVPQNLLNIAEDRSIGTQIGGRRV